MTPVGMVCPAKGFLAASRLDTATKALHLMLISGDFAHVIILLGPHCGLAG